MAGKTTDTLKVAQAMLDLTGEALLTGDFVLMNSCFTLPHTITTLDGEYTVETEQEHRLLFKNIRAEYARLGVTMLDRKIIKAERISDTQIISTHVTHQYAGETLLKEPFPVVSNLTWTGKEWRITTSNYAVESGSKQSRVLAGQTSQDTSPAHDSGANLTHSQNGENT